jgi:hypothetical protein
MRLLPKFYRDLYPELPYDAPLFFAINDHGVSWTKFKLRNGELIRSKYNIPINDKMRSNCHIQYSLADENNKSQQYYGRVHFFLDHYFNEKRHILALVECFPCRRQLHGYITVKCPISEDNAKLIFVNVASIDCLVGLIYVSVEDTYMRGHHRVSRPREANWWILDRSHGKQTYNLVVSDIVNS